MDSHSLRRTKPSPHPARPPKYTLREIAAFIGIPRWKLYEAMRRDATAPRPIKGLHQKSARYYDRDAVLAWWVLRNSNSDDAK